jgi:hypothetical protein
MKKTASKWSEDWDVAWLKECNDRKTPFTEAELDRFVEDFLASMGDVQALREMFDSEGIDKVKSLLKQRFRRQDENNLVNMHVTGPAH